MISTVTFDRIGGTVMVMVALLWMYQLKLRANNRKQRNRP